MAQKNRRVSCVLCGRTEAEAGRMSVTGKCADCSCFVALDAAKQIRERKGPYYERWLNGIVAAAEHRKSLLKELEESSS